MGSLDDGSTLDLERGLRTLGYQAFRPGQREAIETLLTARKLLLVAPTGGGKSLVYQLPASQLPGTTLVVSPLVALMHDQVDALEARGVPATFLAATLSGDEMRERLDRLGAGGYKLAYVAPERLVFPGFRRLLETLHVPLVAVDEAHCISEWGHDFRPDYLEIGRLLAELRPPRVLACTATATPVVRDEILARLELGPDTPQRLHGFARPNLALRAGEVRTQRERDVRVDAQLREALGSAEAPRGAAIVYSGTRRRADEEAARLAAMGWKADAYHAGLSGSTRTEIHQRFSDGRLSIVTATNAFGMGIDRADVRAVVHLAPPGSIEAYYQEVGRAGRDGEPAWGLLLTSPSDLPLRRRLIERGGADGATPAPEVVEHKWNLFLELMRWVEGGSCRHDAILRYFGDEDETTPDGCGRCDVCSAYAARPDDPDEVTLLVRKALSAVARIHQRFGLTAAVKLLMGRADPRLERAGLDRTPTFGMLADRGEDFLLALLRRCVTAGWVDFAGGDRPVACLTRTGRAVMKGDLPARLLLPGPASTLSAPRRRKMAERGVGKNTDAEHLDADATRLFDALRGRRLELARSQGVPPYVVASDRSLREIAVLRPRSVDDLLQVHGVGEAKAEKYGRVWLDIVASAPAAPVTAASSG